MLHTNFLIVSRPPNTPPLNMAQNAFYGINMHCSYRANALRRDFRVLLTCKVRWRKWKESESLFSMFSNEELSIPHKIPHKRDYQFSAAFGNHYLVPVIHRFVNMASNTPLTDSWNFTFGSSIRNNCGNTCASEPEELPHTARTAKLEENCIPTTAPTMTAHKSKHASPYLTSHNTQLNTHWTIQDEHQKTFSNSNDRLIDRNAT